MIEALLATSLTSIVMAAILTAFWWCGNQSSICTKMAWSQREAMGTSMKLTSYIRNASAVTGVDTNEGTWVELAFPNGAMAKLVYSNAVPLQRDGRMYLFSENNGAGTNELLVARGLSEIMKPGGFTTRVFSSEVGGDSVQIAYRVSEPTGNGHKATDDNNFAVSVRFSAALRNQS